VGTAVASIFLANPPPWRLFPALGSRPVREGAGKGSDEAPGAVAMAHASPPAGVPSLAEIFREYAPFVWRGLRRLGVPESDVEDVCQEVFVVVHRKLGDFEGRSSLRTWIYGICARTASDYRRSGRVRREVVTDAPPDAPQEGAQHDTVALKQARATLDRILDELDDDKRAVFVLYEIEELTMAEVAEAIGCPLQTAYSRLHAARKVVEAGVERAQRASAGPMNARSSS
jgi:RNA polymerase sigma-70 factor (ECF subfamily)